MECRIPFSFALDTSTSTWHIEVAMFTFLYPYWTPIWTPYLTPESFVSQGLGGCPKPPLPKAAYYWFHE
jgi:hypothetical protein